VIIKLKIKADRLRILSEFWGLSMQRLARMSANAWRTSKNDFTGDYEGIDPATRNRGKDGKIIPLDTAVIDASDDYTPHQWREMIHVYAEREIAKLSGVIENELQRERLNAELERENLPKYTEVK